MKIKRNFTEDEIVKPSNEQQLKTLKAFALEIKNLVRYAGKTNMIHLNELDLLLVKYDIKIGDLK